MENIDLLVLRTLLTWRLSGRRALLATVVRTWGSSPRPVGSIMALCEDGSVVGSVSGGCIEDDLVFRFARSHAGAFGAISHDPYGGMPSGPPRRIQYGVSADEAHRFGLPCGGTLELLLEFDPDPASLGRLVAALKEGQLMQRRVRLGDGQVTLSSARTPSELRIDDRELVSCFGPEYRMLLIGAGQLSEYLATMALFNGFAVTVCDPRQEHYGAWSVPGVCLVHEMPDDVVQSFRPDRRSCVVALTHDPKLDDLALLDALQTEAFYVGAIGSRRNNEARRTRLIEHFGQSPESLARLRGPIGIFIGSKTPAEIAVSVMAEILAVKNGVPLSADLEVARAKDHLGVVPHQESAVACELDVR